MKQYVVQELPLFNLKTVPCAGSTGRSGLTLSGNTVLGFLFSELLGRVLQRFPAAEFPNQAAKPYVRASPISSVRLRDSRLELEFLSPGVHHRGDHARWIPCVSVSVFKQLCLLLTPNNIL